MSYSFIDEFGFEPPRAVGATMVVKIHKHIMSGTQSDSLEIPDEVIEKQKYATIVGQIVHLGSACFMGEQFKYWTLVPQVGDWIVFKPNPGPLVEYRRKTNLYLMYDDSTLSIIDDPSYVTRD